MRKDETKQSNEKKRNSKTKYQTNLYESFLVNNMSTTVWSIKCYRGHACGFVKHLRRCLLLMFLYNRYLKTPKSTNPSLRLFAFFIPSVLYSFRKHASTNSNIAVVGYKNGLACAQRMVSWKAKHNWYTEETKMIKANTATALMSSR